MIGLIATTAAGRAGCDRLAAAWPDRTRRYDGGAVRDLVKAAFAECDQLVVFLATGAAVRLLAPLLAGKASDPGVVTVDEAHRHAVALLGGHAAGANALAEAVSQVLTTTPVITTATDATSTTALDTLPYPAEGAIPSVTRAFLDATPVHLQNSPTWPLPPLPTTDQAPPSEDRPTPAHPGGAEPTPAAPRPAPADSTDPLPTAAPESGLAPQAPAPHPAATAGRETAQTGGAETTPAENRPAPADSTHPLPTAAPENGFAPHADAPGAPQARPGHGTPPAPHPAATAGRETAQTGGAETTPAENRPAPADSTDPLPTAAPESGLAPQVPAPHTATPPEGGGGPEDATGTGTAAGAAAAPQPAGEYVVWVTDKVVAGREGMVVVRPPSLVVGVGGSRGVSVEEVVRLVRECLGVGGVAVGSLWVLATVDVKAGEEGIVGAADHFGVPLVTYPAEELAQVAVPNPSAAPLQAVGTPSVAEAAALLGAGPGGELLVEKRKSAMATAAVARRRPRGRLAVVGLGPGARDLLTPRAVQELRRASVVVGLDQYVAQVRDLLAPGTRVLESGLGAEEERARTAVAEARAGRAVALVGSGDAGVYAMASPALAEAADDIDVVGVPGVTAALAAAALLGAPLGHDHVSISLSDLHTPWEVIERRVRAAAEADLVVTFYNPRSRGRHWQLPKALALLAEHRSPVTPVGVVRAASRPDEQVAVTTLSAVDPSTVDMVSVVVVGNTASRVVAGRMVTPRGYRWQSAEGGEGV
ncbi:precorrin-3B C(17)-methyltransferase [Actinacidiphila bryophytorum]|uniref:precorrin-3B C(17)-methyltransferase n=1 Tax=Actinacidiphila bryophytorum TaxID=1436133 RepID=UPI002176DFD4|nr:precorrin-3B C(17)-methyltransferase [Actinacidiphila bryophytorum]UWE09064.1 precorrin-3B C(17)-methyltransferase [Actinacidiphila bryophytorum]